MSVFTEILAGAPMIVGPDAAWLERFDVPIAPRIFPAPGEPMIQAPTFAECVRYGGFPDLPEPETWAETECAITWDMSTTPSWTVVREAVGRVALHEADFRREYLGDWVTQRVGDTVYFANQSYMRYYEPNDLMYTMMYRDIFGAPRQAVAGDDESAVDPGIVKELVALAKAGNREDFDFLAGSAGVEDRDALWAGTRARLNLPEPKARPVP